MFQTDINHFLQSFASDGLTGFMSFITDLGYPTFLIGLTIVLMFAVDFKRTFLLIQLFIWTMLITFLFKEYFDLPRPFHVDNTLAFLDGQLPDESSFDFRDRDADSFWGGLPTDVLAETRQADIQNGFPSGHTSGAIALWGALALLFRKRWLTGLSISLMVLIPLSRMYLGVHFLADVLGGTFLGIAIIAALYPTLLSPDRLRSFRDRDEYPIGANIHSFILLILPLVGFLFLPVKYFAIVAYMVGFGISFLILSKRGFPIDEGLWWQRIGRMLIALLIFSTVSYALYLLMHQLGIGDDPAAIFISSLIGSITLIWAGVEAGVTVGWYRRPAQMTSSQT